jgi:hypothetical protein
MRIKGANKRGPQLMQNLRGFFFAWVLLCSGGAQAAQLNMNMHTPTIHEVNPQPLPPGATIKGGSGNPNESFKMDYDKLNWQYTQQQTGTSKGGAGRPLRHPPNPCKGC